METSDVAIVPAKKPVIKKHLITGRGNGAIAKSRKELALLLTKWDCDPAEVACRIIKCVLPCGVCFGTGRTPYLKSSSAILPGDESEQKAQIKTLSPHEIGTRVCQSCFGTRREHSSPELVLAAAKMLINKLMGDISHVTISDPDGGPVQVDHVIRLVRPDGNVRVI